MFAVVSVNLQAEGLLGSHAFSLLASGRVCASSGGLALGNCCSGFGWVGSLQVGARQLASLVACSLWFSGYGWCKVGRQALSAITIHWMHYVLTVFVDLRVCL